MAKAHKVIFYPVGNGDTSQVITTEGRRLLFDFRHCAKSEDADEPEIDLAKKLREELKTSNRNNFDVVAFTHGDFDHIQGSSEFFRLEHDENAQGADRIRADVMWFPAAMLLAEPGTTEEQKREEYILCKEGRHRLLDGAGILVFSRPKALIDWLEGELRKRGLPADARDHLFVDAGQLVPGFTLEGDAVEVFCHSPFIKHCGDGTDIIRNDASLIFNVRMQLGSETYDYLEVGDSTWEVLEEIVTTTKGHGNMDRLEWDIFNIPHHCSYKALSDEKGDKVTDPKPLVKEILLGGKNDSYIVSSSRPILNTKDGYEQEQPPHIQARNAYEKYLEEVGGRKFLVTGEHPRANSPEPIEFEIDSSGLWLKAATSAGTAAILRSTAPRAG